MGIMYTRVDRRLIWKSHADLCCAHLSSSYALQPSPKHSAFSIALVFQTADLHLRKQTSGENICEDATCRSQFGCLYYVSRVTDVAIVSFGHSTRIAYNVGQDTERVSSNGNLVCQCPTIHYNQKVCVIYLGCIQVTLLYNIWHPCVNSETSKVLQEYVVRYLLHPRTKIERLFPISRNSTVLGLLKFLLGRHLTQ